MYSGVLGPFRRYLRGARFLAIPLKDSVVFLGRGRMYVNPADERAQSILRNGGVTQSRVTELFGLINRALRPSLVLDIGANYGEISFSSSYQPDQKVLLFEANPELHPYLHRSLDTRHADRKCFRVVGKAVSDTVDMLSFHIDPLWSGTSRLAELSSSNARSEDKAAFAPRVVKVPATTIDEEVSAAGEANRSVLAKIDVEGHELQVLAGMQNTVFRCSDLALIVEFNRVMPESWRTSLYQALRRYGTVFEILSGSAVSETATPSEISSRDVLVLSNKARERLASQIPGLG
jgi:FkbM family methyltransferase